MFDGTTKRIPMVVVGHIVSFLNLATYTNLKQTSRFGQLVCRQRLASPAIVCCRGVPMCIDPRVPRTRYIRRVEHLYKTAHDVHDHTNYDTAPTSLWLSDHGCDHDRILPTTLFPYGHTFWELAPRVLDLHHVRLQPVDLEEIVRRMSFSLVHLCMNAHDIPLLGVLQPLTNLRNLELYSVNPRMSPDVCLAELTSLQKLAFPVTPLLMARVRTLHDAHKSVLPPQLTHLLVWRDLFDLFDPLDRGALLDWTRLLAAVPHLQCLTTDVVLPSMSTVLPLLRDLRKLKGHIKEQAIDFMPTPVPLAESLEVLHYSSTGNHCARVTQLLNPDVLRELVWHHSRRDNPLLEPVMPLLTDVARFRQLRVLRIFGPVYMIDAITFERLCQGLSLLETLSLSSLYSTSDDQDPLERGVALGGDGSEEEGKRFLRPLVFLAHLRTLHLHKVDNIAKCELHYLPQLTEYTTNAPPRNGMPLHEAFPNLTSLRYNGETPISESMLDGLSHLPFLRRLGTGSRASISPTSLRKFACSRSDTCTPVVAEVAWCHNVLQKDIGMIQSTTSVKLLPTNAPRCVCPSPLLIRNNNNINSNNNNIRVPCRYQPDIQPLSSAESAEIQATQKLDWTAAVVVTAVMALFCAFLIHRVTF